MVKKKKKTNNKIEGVLPELFQERLKSMIPNPATRLQVEKTFSRRETTFRVNTIKSSLDEIKQVLSDNGFQYEQPEWSNLAFILKNKSKRELMDLEIYTNSKIYIQSFASQIPPLVLEPTKDDKVLDLTAAPGSKTSQIAAIMQNHGEFHANDTNKVRFFKLKHNLENLGVTNCKLHLMDGSRFCSNPEYENYFDKILLDAPCSAESRFVIGEIKTFGFWSEKKIKAMASKQRKLLFSAWRALKPGGVLVYSTCTLAPEENELQITKFLEKKTDAKLIPINLSGLKKLEIPLVWKTKQIPKDVITNTLRIKPDSSIEAFYIAKIEKLTTD
jgi:16S rRNA (cytosine1407-C5)-methyltransferase